VYRKGVRFLLSTQYEDGSWLVKTRAIAIQPLFDVGFPHGQDSWISAAGTNWAALALAAAVTKGLMSLFRHAACPAGRVV
jgi:hypothetical protein